MWLYIHNHRNTVCINTLLTKQVGGTRLVHVWHNHSTTITMIIIITCDHLPIYDDHLVTTHTFWIVITPFPWIYLTIYSSDPPKEVHIPWPTVQSLIFRNHLHWYWAFIDHSWRWLWFTLKFAFSAHSDRSSRCIPPPPLVSPISISARQWMLYLNLSPTGEYSSNPRCMHL